MAPPHATTEAPTLVGNDFATMHGVLTDTGGLPTEVRFLYRTRKMRYWYTTDWTEYTTAPTLFYSAVTKLTKPGMKEYMVQARNADGTFDALVVQYWLRWKITAFDGSPFLAYNYQAVGPFGDWTISLTTDVHCHMTMHVDNNVPFRKTGEHYKRGIVYMHTPLTFFSPRWTIQQEEDGDSLSHTFHWTCKKPRGKYTFQGTATTWGRLSPSKTPFYYIACRPEPPPVPTSDQCTWPAANTGYWHSWNAMGQTFRPDHDYTLHSFSIRMNQYSLERQGWVMVKLTRVGGNCWSEQLLWATQLYSFDFPNPGSQDWITFNVGNIPLQAGVNYRILPYAFGEWWYWYSGSWRRGDNRAAMKCWTSDTGHDYPRGTCNYGCNIRDQSDWWRDLGVDMNFICWERPYV